MIRNIRAKLTGRTPLLMHHDNIDWADTMSEWQKDPEHKGQSKAGDDRTPPWRWIGAGYRDEHQIVMPQENIMASMMEGGAQVPTGNGKKTFKAQTQSGMMCTEPFFPLLVKGKPVPWAPIEKLMTSAATFTEQKRMVQQWGFSLLVKRAHVGTSKHIRVRPMFAAGWEVLVTLSVWDDMLTTQNLRTIFSYAGTYKGLGDWRPGAPKKPGPYGTFDALVEEA